MLDFTDAERAIFEWADDAGPRKGDPQVLYRDLMRGLHGSPLGGEGGLLDALARGDNTVAFEAAGKLFPAVQAAFGLKPLQPDGTGCTERMQFRVLNEFLSFIDALKKKRDS